MEQQIAQFVSITGLDSDRARFFVESAGGDVETALSTFYESEGQADGDEGEDETTVPAPVAQVTSGPRTLGGQPAPEVPSDWASKPATSSSAQRPGGGFSASGGRGGIATLRDMQGDDIPAPNDDDNDDNEGGDDKGPANFYTGGERSGLSVQNPDRARGNAPDVVQNILKQAAEASRERTESSSRAPASTTSAPRSFGGRGRTIGSEDQPEEPASPTSQHDLTTSEGLRALRNTMSRPPMGQQGDNEENDADEDEEDEIAIRNITFWQDGFSIANGPLCRYDDPQHAETLALINTNRAPLHLLNVRFGQRVELRVERRTNEKYQPPPPEPLKPFGGQGNRLGAPVPQMSGGAPSPAATSTIQAATTAAVEPPATFQVDSSQPTTQVQIRLGDGERMVAEFNHSHTIADVRRYINASHPGMGSRPYTLQPSYPPKPLTDEEQTLKDAGLVNAVIIQKWS